MLLTAVASVDPIADSHHASVGTDVSATFDQTIKQTINPDTVTTETFAVHSAQRGKLTGGAIETTGATVILDPMSNFSPGELVEVTATSGIRNATSAAFVSFPIDFNGDLLAITGVTPRANIPAGSTTTVDTSTPGRAVVTFNSPTDLPAGPIR